MYLHLSSGLEICPFIHPLFFASPSPGARLNYSVGMLLEDLEELVAFVRLSSLPISALSSKRRAIPSPNLASDKYEPYVKLLIIGSRAF
jgi:hypothetical protein